MKDFKRLFILVRPYHWRILVFFVFATLMVIFNTLTFVMSSPFLQVLFDPEALKVTSPPPINDLNAVMEASQYQLGEYIKLHGQGETLKLLCLFIIAVFFLKNLFRYAAVFTIIPVRHGIAKTLRDQLFEKVLQLPLSYFAEERKGDLIVRMTNDIEEFRKHSLNMLEALLKDPFAIILSFVFLLAISPKLTLIAVGMMLFIVLVIARVSSTLKFKSTKAQNKMADITIIVEEALSGLRIIKGFNALNYQRQKFRAENNSHKNILSRISWRTASASPLSEFLGATSVSLLLLIGGYFVVNGEFLAGNLIAFIAVFWSMITPLKGLANAYFNLKKGFGAGERINELLHAESNILEKDNPKPIEVLNASVEYKNVSFAYNNDQTVLQNISFRLQKGKILALVGASGSGKSTLVDLLPRFYDTQTGDILIDGVSVKDYKIGDLRQLMGIVSQEPILFNDTIENNIAFGLNNVSKEKIMAAAKKANAHDFILQSPNGYGTIIGDRGMKLSGGQRQRLTIARAILRNPQILILDEATSSLDSESEQLVQDALSKLMQNRTSIVIAHRLSTIQNADEILVLNEGKIVERGTHHHLLDKNGIYQKLVELQTL